MIAISFIFFGLILQTVDSYENVTEMITGNSLDPSNETRQESSSNGGRPLHGTQVRTTPLEQQVELGLFYYDEQKNCVDPIDDLSQYCLSLLVNGSRIQENLELYYFINGELVFTYGPDGQLKAYGPLKENFREHPEDLAKPCYGLPFANIIPGTYFINDRSGNYNTTGVKMDLYYCYKLYETVTEMITGNSLDPSTTTGNSLDPSTTTGNSLDPSTTTGYSLDPSTETRQESSSNRVMYLAIVIIVLLPIPIIVLIWNWRKIQSRCFPQHSVPEMEQLSKTAIEDKHAANMVPLITSAPEQ